MQQLPTAGLLVGVVISIAVSCSGGQATTLPAPATTTRLTIATTSPVATAPPPFKPYLFKDVLLNPFATQITHALLGDVVTNIGYNANTAFSGSQPQNPHADVASLWPDLKKVHPPAVLRPQRAARRRHR